jgi:hypothetical protein
VYRRAAKIRGKPPTRLLRPRKASAYHNLTYTIFGSHERTICPKVQMAELHFYPARPPRSEQVSGEILERSFMRGEAENSAPGHQGTRVVMIGHDDARQVGHISNTHNHYYSSGRTDHSRVLEWLWHPTGTPCAKQKSLHSSASNAREAQRDPWLLEHPKFENWINGDGGGLWIRGKGNSERDNLNTAY